MGLISWMKSTNQGSDAADMIIDEGMTDISDESLYALAEKVEASNPDAFVEQARFVIDRHMEDEEIRASGSWMQKFRRGVF